MELFYWLLFTLPGSPVLYYGDEIGMGDNVHLGDRDSVRTPMQWTGDRNAGFSQAAPEALYLPVISDPVYGYQAVNVESQRQNGGSLLRWLSHILSVRREHPQLAIGSFTPVPVENPAVFAYIRGGLPEAPDPILCIANLHRQAQPAAIPLPDHVGARPLELLGDVPFPTVGTDPYPVTLASRGFLAFELRPEEPGGAAMNVHDLPTPALVLDHAAFEANLAAMAGFLPGPRLRPHVKAHKCTGIAGRAGPPRAHHVHVRDAAGDGRHGAGRARSRPAAGQRGAGPRPPRRDGRRGVGRPRRRRADDRRRRQRRDRRRGCGGGASATSSSTSTSGCPAAVARPRRPAAWPTWPARRA